MVHFRLFLLVVLAARVASALAPEVVCLVVAAGTHQPIPFASLGIAGKKLGPAVTFSHGAQLGGVAPVRPSSLGTWRREPDAILAAYLTVRR